MADLISHEDLAREALRRRLGGAEAADPSDLIAFAARAESTADVSLVSRKLAELPHEVEGLRTLRVALLRSSTVELVVPWIETACVRRGIRPLITVGAYDGIAQDILGGDGRARGEPADVLVVWSRLQQLHPGLWHDFAELFPQDVEQAVGAAFERVENWVKQARARFDAPVLVANMERPRPLALGLYDAGHAQGQVQAVAALNRRLAELASETPGVYVWDVAGCQADVGLAHWFDARLAAMARFPYAPDAQRALGDSLARTLRALVTSPRKCLVLDLDNTLWGGILGEDGAHGIRLGPDYPGNLYHAFQREILNLYHRGVLLAVASKNDHVDAHAVLAEHPHMALRPERFAALQIHWRDKAESLRAIAAELDIGTDALVFIDDNPVECARVRQVMPEVLTIQAPSDPLKLADVLRQLEAFDALALSSEDRGRSAMYQAQKQRKALAEQAGSLEDFYRSLRMVARIGRADATTYSRIAQLQNKTKHQK